LDTCKNEKNRCNIMLSWKRFWFSRIDFNDKLEFFISLEDEYVQNSVVPLTVATTCHNPVWVRQDAFSIKIYWLKPTLHTFTGICETPFTWSRLQDVIQDGSLEALSTLGRTPQVWREYRDFKNSYILQHYASTVDYLMIQIFQCPCTTNNGMHWFFPSWHGRHVSSGIFILSYRCRGKKSSYQTRWFWIES
jgi:hypothetical protein